MAKSSIIPWILKAAGLFTIGGFALFSLEKFSVFSFGEVSLFDFTQVSENRENIDEELRNLTVTISDEATGEFIKNAKVYLYDSEGVRSNPRFADDVGYVIFEEVSLSNSSYIYVEAEGYAPGRFFYKNDKSLLVLLERVEPGDEKLDTVSQINQENFDRKDENPDLDQTKIETKNNQLSIEDATNIVQAWLNSKTSLYNAPYDIEAVSNLMYRDGGLRYCLQRTVIPKLKSKSLKYEFIGRVLPGSDQEPHSFYSNSDNAGGIFNINEVTVVKSSDSDFERISESYARLYEFRRDEESGLWQIDDFCTISSKDNQSCVVSECREHTLEYSPLIIDVP